MSAARICKYWLPVVLWMFLIFSASTDLGAPRNSSRIIKPFLRWLNPGITDQTVDTIQFVIRKSCHAMEYAFLALLLWRARRNLSAENLKNDVSQKWHWSHARFAILISAIYAATDEFHQYFVASRQGSILDVLLDTTGAIIGMLLLWMIGRFWRRW